MKDFYKHYNFVEFPVAVKFIKQGLVDNLKQAETNVLLLQKNQQTSTPQYKFAQSVVEAYPVLIHKVNRLK